MGWLQNKLPNVPINNFNSDWNDGRKVKHNHGHRQTDRRWDKQTDTDANRQTLRTDERKGLFEAYCKIKIKYKKHTWDE